VSKVFAKNLRAFRLSAGLTQDELARRAGITRNAIANYESGRTEPNFEALCFFCSELGVDAEQLITEQEYRPYVYMRQVTDDEAARLDAYRKADEVYQGVALDILRQHKKVVK
jgi:transcriptional regulator with XRE-family HTH domain